MLVAGSPRRRALVSAACQTPSSSSRSPRNTQPCALFAAEAYTSLLENGVFNVDWWNVHNGPGKASTVAGQPDYDDFGPIDSERFLRFLWKIAGRPEVYPADWRRERELVIWMDNYSVHKSERVRDEMPELERAGITIRYLPSYTPELSKIEPIWQDVKYHRLTQRSYTEVPDLKRATNEALAQKAVDLLTARPETTNSLRRAA